MRPDPAMIAEGEGEQEEDIRPGLRIGAGPYGRRRAYRPDRMDQWPDELLAKVANSNHPLAGKAHAEIMRRFNERAGVIGGVRKPGREDY